MSDELIIIDQIDQPGLTATDGSASPSPCIIQLNYRPSHDLPTHIIDKRFAHARKVIAKLKADLTAPADSPEE